MYNIFYILLLKIKTTRKGLIDKNIIRQNFVESNCKEYRVEVFWNKVIYTRKLEIDLLIELYYIVF